MRVHCFLFNVLGLATIAVGMVGCWDSPSGVVDGADASAEGVVDAVVEGPIDAGPLDACDKVALRGEPSDIAQPGLCARMGGAYVSDDAGEVRVEGQPFGDLDGDGVAEFIVSDCGDGPCIVGGGDSEALLQPAAAIANGTAFPVPWTRPAGDLNGDGLIDLAFVEVVEDEVWLRVAYGSWPWRGLGVDILLEVLPGDGSGCPLENLGWKRAMPIGDLDGGGSDDLLLTRTCGDEHGGSSSVIMHGEDLDEIANAGLPPWESPGVTTFGGGYLAGVASGDFNGDGVLDLAYGQYPDPLNMADSDVSLSGIAIVWGPIGAGRIGSLGPRPSHLPPLEGCLADGTWIDIHIDYGGADMISDGDVDDDGFDDLLVATGAVYVVHGGPELDDVVVDSSHANISRIDVIEEPVRSPTVLGTVPACPDEDALPAIAAGYDSDFYYWVADGSAATQRQELITAAEFEQLVRAQCQCQR